MAEENEAGEGHNSKKIDFDGAAKIMKSDLAKLRDAGAKTRGEQAAAWKRIEEMNVNKKAAKAVFSLQNQGAATVSDYLRTFIGLLDPLGLGIIRDMVDDAEGKDGIMVPLIETPSVDA